VWFLASFLPGCEPLSPSVSASAAEPPAALLRCRLITLLYPCFEVGSCGMTPYVLHVLTQQCRRHWWTSISWTQLHLPLSGAIVLVASALKKMVIAKDVGQGHRWYFGIGEFSIRMSLQHHVEHPKLRYGYGHAMLRRDWFPPSFA
jgi:hypothetical protein